MTNCRRDIHDCLHMWKINSLFDALIVKAQAIQLKVM